MAISQPISTDPLNSPDHSLSHRVFANDDSSPVQSVVISSTGMVTFGTVTWNDIYIPLAGAKTPAVNTPTWTTFLANLNSYTFALNDYADLSTAEILHGYSEGTDIGIHLHLVTNGLNNATERKAKYTIYYSIGDMDEVMSAQASLTAEATITANLADKTHLFLDMGDITGTGFKIGSIIKMRVTRVAGTGTEPASNPFVEMVGIHYQCNTVGSESELTK